MALDAAHITRVTVILNDRAGTSSKQLMADRVVEHLAAHGREVEITIARTAEDLVAAAQRAASSDADLVVAGGGDGTILTVATPLVGTSKVLGILPLGTFNYFARRINVPIEFDRALQVLTTGHAATVDVGDVNGHVFLNNASIGLYPTVLRRRETTYRLLGRSQAIAYASAALALVQPPALLNLRIDIDGVPLSRRTPLVYIGMSEYQLESLGIPGLECVRANRFAVYITRPLPLLSLWKLALRAFFRGLYGASELEVVCAREVRTHLRRRRLAVALDGELQTVIPPAAFTIKTGALRVLAGVGEMDRIDC